MKIELSFIMVAIELIDLVQYSGPHVYAAESLPVHHSCHLTMYTI